jgi:hypothetical protein
VHVGGRSRIGFHPAETCDARLHLGDTDQHDEVVADTLARPARYKALYHSLFKEQLAKAFIRPCELRPSEARTQLRRQLSLRFLVLWTNELKTEPEDRLMIIAKPRKANGLLNDGFQQLARIIHGI